MRRRRTIPNMPAHLMGVPMDERPVDRSGKSVKIGALPPRDARGVGTQPPWPTPCLNPSPALLAKLGSIVVHVAEGSSAQGHAFDWQTARQLSNDPEVVEWLSQMGKLAMIPVRRDARPHPAQAHVKRLKKE